ncbi:MAG: hypothetical protein GXZ15_00435 [Campylobacter sp.]|nr:hypothetical protein [Campylobacter sp.]
MKKLVFNLAIILLSFGFILWLSELNLVGFVFFGLFFTLLFYFEIFSFSYTKRLIYSRAFFSGVLKKLFSGKIFVTISSLLSSLVFTASLVFNTLAISSYEFISICLFIPALFITVRFVVLKVSQNNVKFHQILTKKYTILITAILSSLIFALLSLSLSSQTNTNIFMHLSKSEFNRSFNIGFLNEIYVYAFYLNSAFSWLQSSISGWQKVFYLVFFALNKFIFFTAICIVLSVVFSRNSLKDGYFLKTVSVLAYITLALITTNSLNSKISIKKPESISKKLVDIILLNGAKLTLSQDEFKEVRANLSHTKDSNLSSAKLEINSFIDEFYEKGAKALANKISDFRYSFLTEYLVLFHGIKDGNNSEFILRKFSEFADESFDKNVSNELEEIIAKNLENYTASLYSNFSTKINTDLSYLNLESGRFKVSGSATISSLLAGKTLAKVGIKTAAKTSTKATISGVGASAGVFCGPGAPLCWAILGVVTWFGVDYTVSKGEEIIGRDEYEFRIYSELMEEKKLFKNELNLELDELYSQILDTLYEIN